MQLPWRDECAAGGGSAGLRRQHPRRGPQGGAGGSAGDALTGPRGPEGEGPGLGTGCSSEPESVLFAKGIWTLVVSSLCI